MPPPLLPSAASGAESEGSGVGSARDGATCKVGKNLFEDSSFVSEDSSFLSEDRGRVVEDIRYGCGDSARYALTFSSQRQQPLLPAVTGEHTLLPHCIYSNVIEKLWLQRYI